MIKPELIYNKYIGKITVAYKDDIYLDDDGWARVKAKRKQEREKYLFNGFKEDGSDNIVLIECPPDVLAIEFEEHSTKVDDLRNTTKEQREKWVKETFENAKKKGMMCCIVEHGGTSPYFYAFNIEGLPEGNETEAKKYIAKSIAPQPSIDFIDWTNIGKTLIPVIGRSHWKPKYKGTIHQIKEGDEPQEQKNNTKIIIPNFLDGVSNEIIKTEARTKGKDVENVKSKSNLIDFLNNYGYDLSKNPTMCRLGHGSKGGKCFSWDEHKGLWYCFHCGKGGDIFNLVREHQDVNFYQSLKIIADSIKYELTENEEEDYGNYEILKDKYGYLFVRECQTEKGIKYIREIADFDIIENQHVCKYDMVKGKWSMVDQFEFIIKQEAEIAYEPIGLKNVLTKARREKARIRREDEKAFGHNVYKFTATEKKTTNCYGFIGTNYLDYPNYELYNSSFVQTGADIKEVALPISVSDSYKEFIEIKPDNEHITKLVGILNHKYARNEKEKKLHKLIFSWSISSALKMVLKKNGIKLHPILVGLGEKRKGKSTAMEMFITSLWNNTLLQPDHFEGVKGTRLKQIDNTLFPLYCDELISLDRFAEILKNSTIRGFMKIPRGRKDGTIDENVKFFNLAVSSNNYSVKDPALKDRMIIFNYDDCGKPKLNELEINWLNDNMKHLGKKIYDKFKDYDFATMVNSILKDIGEKYRDRDIFKLVYVGIGSKILEDLGLYKDVEISDEMILGSGEHISITLSDTLKDIVLRIISNQKISFRLINSDGIPLSETITVNRILSEKNYVNKTTFDHLSTNGVYIGAGYDGIIITKKFLPLINEELKKKDLKMNSYKDIYQFAADAEINIAGHPLKIEKPDNEQSSVRGILIFKKDEIIEYFDYIEEEVK